MENTMIQSFALLFWLETVYVDTMSVKVVKCVVFYNENKLFIVNDTGLFLKIGPVMC